MALSGAGAANAQVMERVRPNDNRARAGIMGNGALAVRMEARMAMWHPDGDDKPGAPIPVFAELGRPAQVPGPLIRAPGGTDIIVMVRNQVPNATLTIHGLHARPAIGEAFSDSVQLAPGTVQTLRFRLDRPGTYYYWGTITGSAFGNRTHEDAQLSGAIVVDEPGERTPRDRIFVIGMWTDAAASDSARHRQRELVVVNGRSWPATDRIQYERGETVRWRVINASVDPHPMYLHGFAYRVLRRGDGMVDTVLTRAEPVHTERVAPGGTFAATWVADRLGNWLFQCDEPEHSEARGPLGYPPQTLLAAAGAPLVRGLGGLIAGIEVKHAEDDTTAGLPPPPLPVPARRLRMELRPNVGSSGTTPLYGIAIDEVGIELPPPDSGQRAGPTLVLNRAEPVSIMVVNNLPEPTSIHWYGVDGESLFDGVPGFSGIKPNQAPMIAPADSFEVRLAPPRSGTFAYRAQVNVARQMRAGLVGALIVTDKGKYDAIRNLPIVVSSPSDSAAEEQSVLINGSFAPAPLELRRGTAYRLRMVNLTTGRRDVVLELRQDSTFATWRPIAKDGFDLPPSERAPREASLSLSIGEAKDVEFSPVRSGDYRLEARTQMRVLLGTLPVRVF